MVLPEFFQRKAEDLSRKAIYQEHLDDLDLEELAKEFVLRNTKRENMFQIPK